MKNNAVLSLLALSVALVISGCDEGAKIDPARQTGANPELPAAKSFLVPPMKVPDGEPWKKGEAPKVAQGLKIERKSPPTCCIRASSIRCLMGTCWSWRAARHPDRSASLRS